MKINALLLLCLFVVSPLVFSAECNEQIYKPLTGYSIQLDENEIAMGPPDSNGVSKRLLIGVVTVPLGRSAVYKLIACDPDGDQLEIRCQDGLITKDDNEANHYYWTWKPLSIGVTYHWIEAQDVRPLTNDSLTTRGTIVVIVIPANRPPVLCGGLSQ